MGPVLNMTVGYLLPKRLFHFGSPASIWPRNGCPAVPTKKSLLKPTGLVCTAAVRKGSASNPLHWGGIAPLLLTYTMNIRVDTICVLRRQPASEPSASPPDNESQYNHRD